jgi:N-acetylneuraminate synthase/N,N'-diacetyllegionaminate synthase
MTTLAIGDRRVGPGAPCFLVAEVGINHNGDMDLAERTIDAAAAAGADAVKLQNYRTEDFVEDRALTYEYVTGGRRVVESQYAMFKRCELDVDRLRRLKRRADARGVVLFSTPTSEATLADCLAAGFPLLKNGSDFLGHLPLVRAMGATGLPTLLSTGMATLGEIDEAVRAFRETGNDRLVLLHCTSSYPTPPEDVHLRKIPALAAAFGCPTGLSDHSVGVVAALGAVALGACCVEKHFTLDRTLPGPDHAMSSDPEEFGRLVDGVRALERALGEARIGPAASERTGRLEYRLSCAAARALPAGHVLADKDLVFRRPGRGVPPAQAALLVGRRLTRAVAQGQVLLPEDFAP